MDSADTSRPDATSSDNDYSLTIDEVADRYARAGHPRTPRTIQRYCASGHLDCHKIETTWGDKYVIAPYSVVRHIAQIEEIAAATGRGLPRHVATIDAHLQSHEGHQADTATGRDLSRPDAASSRNIELLEKENGFLHEQILVKDSQINDLTERARETNHLIAGLQKMLSPLLGSGERSAPQSQPHGPEPEQPFTPQPSDASGEGDNSENRPEMGLQ